MSKRLDNVKKSFDVKKRYKIDEAISFFTEEYNIKYRANFDETLEFIVQLGIDLKKSNQVVRGSVTMPNGLDRKRRIAIIADKSKIEESRESGADFIGGEDLIEKIKSGFLDFEVCIATPSMMPKVSSVSKLLGPKNLMPNPKFGTVTDNIVLAVRNINKGQVEFRSDKAGIVQAGIAKTSFESAKIKENIVELYNAIVLEKPSKSKGVYIKDSYLSSTHGPSLRLDLKSFVV